MHLCSQNFRITSASQHVKRLNDTWFHCSKPKSKNIYCLKPNIPGDVYIFWVWIGIMKQVNFGTSVKERFSKEKDMFRNKWLNDLRQ